MDSSISMRKRARTGASETSETGTTVRNVSFNMIPKTSSSQSQSQSHSPSVTSLMTTISSLQTELSSVTSQRRLDGIQHSNTTQRLNRHIQALKTDASEAQNMAEEIRTENEGQMEAMKERRNQAVNEAREWEDRYWNIKDGSENSEDNEALQQQLRVSQHQKDFLDQKCHNLERELQSLKHTFSGQKAQTETAADIVDSSDDEADILGTATATATPKKSKPEANVNVTTNNENENILLSPAPPAVLSELNRTRVQLAEANLAIRQNNRTLTDLQSQADQMITYRESFTSLQKDHTTLTADFKKVTREREALRLMEGRWKDFRGMLVKNKLGSETIDSSVAAVAVAVDENVPPEIATVIRHQQDLEHTIQQYKMEQTTFKSQLEETNNHMRLLTSTAETNEAECQKLQSEMMKTKKEYKTMELELETIKAREGVWKREASSMRSLVETYKMMENQMVMAAKKSKGGASTPKKQENTSTGTGTGTCAEALEVSLTASQEEIQLLQKQCQQLQEQHDDISNAHTTLQTEYDTVKIKFGKLREALMKERENASQAEERMIKAETLVGKGSYNEDTTKCLHLAENPFSMAVREMYQSEIEGLKADIEQLQVAATATATGDTSMESSTGNSAAAATATIPTSNSSSLDAQKFSKRLKDQFREQIGLFREGVYLITGLKVDMNMDPANPDAIRFKVRSMYNERESDHLELLWRKNKKKHGHGHGKGGEGQGLEGWASSLDILDTPLAQEMAKESAFDYMKKFQSLPAFIASVCLTLFERQTLAI